MLYSHLHIHNTNISGNIDNNNDDFNERTNTLLYKNISHTLFSKVLMLVVCERWVGDGDRLLHIDPSSSDHSSTSFSSWLSAQPWVTEGPKPSVCRWFSIPHLVLNWLQLGRTASSTWLYNCLSSTCSRCSSAYLDRCISWLTARSRVNMLHSVCPTIYP